jgi:Uma2 family endonuclease
MVQPTVSTTVTALPTFVTFGDVLSFVDDLPVERIRLKPVPGTATERDVLDVYEKERRLCELVDGILVEKTVGAYESYLACLLAQFIGPFVRSNDLGIVLGADGMMRLFPGLVRIPDVSFISWSQLPSRKFPRQPILRLAPVLAVEVLSPGNTEREMSRKLQEYFDGGARQVWYLDPSARTMTVYKSPATYTVHGESDTLDGGDILPGFSLPLAQLFAVPREEELA